MTSSSTSPTGPISPCAPASQNCALAKSEAGIPGMTIITVTGTILPPAEEALVEENNFHNLWKPFLASEAMDRRAAAQDNPHKDLPEEDRIIEFVNEIVMAREALRERDLPEFIRWASTPKPRHTRRMRSKSCRHAAEISRTKAPLLGRANAYYERAKSDANDVGKLNEKIAAMLGASQKPPRSRR